MLDTSAMVRSEAIRLALATPFAEDRILLELRKLSHVWVYPQHRMFHFIPVATLFSLCHV